MKSVFWNKLGEGFVKLGVKLRHQSPKILIISGIVGGVATVVMACVATTKTPPVISDARDKVQKIHDEQEKRAIVAANADGKQVALTRVDKESRQELTRVYMSTGWELAKIYMPAAGVGVLSALSILAGGKVLSKRNVALMAAYTTVDNSYRQYRARIANKYGEETDREIRGDLTPGHIIEKVVDENGKETDTDKQVLLAGAAPSDYARYFDRSTTKHCEVSHEYNLMYLRGQQNTANDMLRARKWLYLNDIYELLGLKHSVAGQEVGWVYDQALGKDNFIDFGIQEVYRPDEDDPTQLVPTILLDFNVDGPVSAKAVKLDLIEA